MLEWLWSADSGLILGALGFVTGIASLLYARSEVRGTRAQLESGKEQAAEAVHTAGEVAENARKQAVEALRAAGLVAENAKEQARQALLAADLLADAEVSARVRDMRARNFRANPNLPSDIRQIMKAVGGPDAYSVMLDSIDIAQEIFILRQRDLVSDENWRRWMNDQLLLISTSPHFQDIFRREAEQDVLLAEFVEAFQPVFEGRRIADPAKRQRGASEQVAGPLDAVAPP